MISPDLHFYRESTVNKVSALFFTFVEIPELQNMSEVVLNSARNVEPLSK
jgi:hypothetical protein